jgi:hypothetical protein
LFFASGACIARTVNPDKLDYTPARFVIITGTGWISETVSFHFDETPKPATCLLSHDNTTDINIFNEEFLIKINHIGVSFCLNGNRRIFRDGC